MSARRGGHCRVLEGGARVFARSTRRLRRVARFRHAAQIFEPSLMASRKHPPQIPSRDHRQPSALRLLGDNTASRSTRLQDPSVVGVKSVRTRVPSDFVIRLERSHDAAYAGAEGAPFEAAADSQVRSALFVGVAKSRAVAVPLRPALTPD